MKLKKTSSNSDSLSARIASVGVCQPPIKIDSNQ
jgi:hypothetical protein